MPPRPKYAKTDWIALGTAALTEDGPEAVRLDAICKRAGVTKGSFYHHFPDHAGFLLGIVQDWAARAVASLGAADTSQMLLAPALEEGIRSLAARSPAVAQAVAEVEAERVQTLANRYVDRFEVLWSRATELAELELAVLRGGGHRDPALTALHAKMVDSHLRPPKQSPKPRGSQNEAQPSLFPLTP